MRHWTLKVIQTELHKILAYRSEFWANFIGNTAVHFVVATALWHSIFESQGVTELRGLTLPQLTLYYVLAPITVKALSGENIGFFSREIYDGGLNRYLVWPMPALGYKALTYLTQSAFYLVQLVVLYLAARLIVDPAPLASAELVRLAVGIAYLCVACVGFFLLMCMCEMISFWFDHAWTLGVMLRFALHFFGGTLVPLTFYPEALRSILSALPFASMASAPIRHIMGQATMAETGQALLVLLLWLPVLALLVVLMWRRGNLRYTGVGM